MKKWILSILFMVFITGYVAASCPADYDNCIEPGLQADLDYFAAYGFYHQVIDNIDVGTVWHPISGICDWTGTERSYFNFYAPGMWDHFKIRYYDKAGVNDSFNIYNGGNVYVATVFDEYNDNSWHEVIVDIPENLFNDGAAVQLIAIGEEAPDCGEYGQVAIEWFAVKSRYNPVIVPEFKVITLSLSILGALGFFFFVRRR